MFAIVDTETTGGNPAQDRIMEIAIFIHDGEKVVDEFSTLINPEKPISPFIIGLTGISNEMVAHAPTFSQVADKIFDLTDQNIFVAHNARFDYGVMRREFRRLGIRFQRKQLCTVSLSRKMLPDLKSYSLGKLCREIGINIKMRHRATGDAEATVKLLEVLLSNDRERIINSVWADELENINLPPALSKETVDDLPEETGVYYYLDENMNVLYVGRGKNIRKKVIDQFIKDFEQREYARFWNKITDVSFELTGSELIAQLMELSEVRKHAPPYNTKRKRKYRFGIYAFYDDKGYINFEIDNIRQHDQALIASRSRNGALNIMKKLEREYELAPALCGLKIDNENARQISLNPQLYNLKASRLLSKYRYNHPNFFIIGDGRSHHEQSVVWIENNQYKGYGFFEPENIENDIQSLKESVEILPNTHEVHRLIRNWLRKKTRDEIISY